MLRSDLRDYSDAYISLTGTDNASRRNKKLTFKNNASFRTYMQKIYITFIGNAGDLDIVVLVTIILL